MSSYKDLFLKSAREYIDVLKKNLPLLNSQENNESAYELFRAVHSIKGQSLLMGYPRLNELCATLQTYFRDLYEKKIQYDPAVFDNLESAFDTLEKLLETIERENNETDLSQNIKELRTVLKVTSYS